MACPRAPQSRRRRSRSLSLAAFVCSFVALAARPASAQQRDTTRRPTRADSAKADSAAIADSLRIIRELERIRGEPRVPVDQSTPPQTGTQGPTNPRLLPDISAVGDLIGDLSPKGSTQEGGQRFAVREVEVAVQAAVDPYFRGDIFLGFSDEEGVSIEQAFLTATSLPYALDVRLGRFLMPVGKQNTTHRHDLHTIEYPWVIQRFFGAEGLKGTGVWLARVFSPLGFYQEIQLTAVDRFGDPTEGLTVAEPVNKKLGGLGYSARLRNYWDLSQSTNLEVSASAITGKREQPVSGLATDAVGVPARQSVFGADVTFRWRPLQQGLYKSFIVQAELMRQQNEEDPDLSSTAGMSSGIATYAGPTRNPLGGYIFARWQLTRRTYLSGRFDAVEDAFDDDATLRAGSGYVELFPSEFSKLMVGYEHVSAPAGHEPFTGKHRIILQATFALGPHKPHPF
jgi:hypothetical protein